MASSHILWRRRGAATAEFALVAAPLLLAGFALAEGGHWLLTRQVVRLALHEASRVGATQHAHPEAIGTAFEQALSPLYVPAGAHGTPQARMRASHDRLRRTTGQQAWRIELAGPPASAYQDFGHPSGQHGGRAAISNDYLAEQHARAQARWPHGVGPRSGLNIHQANVLQLRLTYLKRPLTPIVASVLKAAAMLAPEQAKSALSAGLLSMRMQSSMTMQSDPVAWELSGEAMAGMVGESPRPAPLPPALPARPTAPRNSLLPPGSAVIPAVGEPPYSPVPGNVLPTEDEPSLCGVVLCCS